MANNWKVKWSPNQPDYFVAGGPQALHLFHVYETLNRDGEEKNENPEVSHDFQKKLDIPKVSKSPNYTNNVYKNLKNLYYSSFNSQGSLNCLDWSHDKSHPQTVAFSTGNSGKIHIVDFEKKSKTGNEKDWTELTPHPRKVYVLKWNPLCTNFIASGMMKVRGIPSCAVWDVNAEKPVFQENRFELRASQSTIDTGSYIDIKKIALSNAQKCISSPYATFIKTDEIADISWKPGESNILGIGMKKFLQLYDIREEGKAINSISFQKHKLNCFEFDPFFSNRFATYSDDGCVRIYDLRKHDFPIFSFETSEKSNLDLQWCTSEPGILATLSKFKNKISFWDLSGVLSYEDDDIDKEVQRIPPNFEKLIRCRKKISEENVSSMSWNYFEKTRYITISSSGLLGDNTIYIQLPVVISPFGNKVAFAMDHILYEKPVSLYNTEKSEIERDISEIMNLRAKDGFSLNFSRNFEICKEMNMEKDAKFWIWINKWMKSVQDSNLQKSLGISKRSRSNVMLGFLGCSEMLNIPLKTPESKSSSFRNRLTSVTSSDHNILKSKSLTKFPQSLLQSYTVYQSKSRSIILNFCGWCELSKGFGISEKFENSVLVLEDEGEWEKAAAFSVFHLDVKRAIKSLIKGAEVTSSQIGSRGKSRKRSFGTNISEKQPNVASKMENKINNDIDPDDFYSGHLRMTALALSGFSESKDDSLWLMTCKQFQSQILHPYLQAMFSFLLNCKESAPDFEEVFNNHLIPLSDRIAFVCRFLSDERLKHFFSETYNFALQQGSLDGLIITGLLNDETCLSLLQSYLDRTSDIQTVAILSCFISGRKLEHVKNWIDTYRGLLDCWKMWHIRARFDIDRSNVIACKPSHASKPIQTFVRCQWCGKPFGLDKQKGVGIRQPGYIGGSSNAGGGPVSSSRSKSCPQCSRSLPRCALCLVNMTVASSMAVLVSAKSKNLNESKLESKSSNTDGKISFPVEEWFSWCQKCRHGGHTSHIRKWFTNHSVCPVASCNCNCLNQDILMSSQFEDN